jgi:hypothetical protein
MYLIHLFRYPFKTYIFCYWKDPCLFEPPSLNNAIHMHRNNIKPCGFAVGSPSWVWNLVSTDFHLWITTFLHFMDVAQEFMLSLIYLWHHLTHTLCNQLIFTIYKPNTLKPNLHIFLNFLTCLFFILDPQIIWPNYSQKVIKSIPNTSYQSTSPTFNKIWIMFCAIDMFWCLNVCLDNLNFLQPPLQIWAPHFRPLWYVLFFSRKFI